MIREFNRDEVLDTFVEVAREASPIFRADQSTGVELNLVLHSVIKETIERVIKKASPDLSVMVQVNAIHNEIYGYVNEFEPVFSSDPSDVHFYITREAVPASYRFKGEILVTTTTHIDIDYHYPAYWAMTPPRDEKAASRRTMDEILFAWTIVSKTLLSAPIVRFDDEDEAAEAIFASANILLFCRVVAGYYYRQDFISRLMNIEKTLRGNQRVRGDDLATIVWPKDNKIGSLDVPVVDIENNKITQFVEGYVACRGQECSQEYRTVLKAFTLYERFAEDAPFSEEDVNYYLANNVGQPVDDYRNYNMHKIQRLVVNGDFKAARPPMIDVIFKGIRFTKVCPFTYGASSLIYIHFEKDIISHLERVFKHSNIEYATDIAKGMKLPEGDRVNKTYDIDTRLIDLFQLSGANDPIDKEVYRNKGLYLAEEEAAKQDLEANAQEAVRSMEFAEEGVPRGAFMEYAAHWIDAPF